MFFAVLQPIKPNKYNNKYNNKQNNNASHYY